MAGFAPVGDAFAIGIKDMIIRQYLWMLQDNVDARENEACIGFVAVQVPAR